MNSLIRPRNMAGKHADVLHAQIRLILCIHILVSQTGVSGAEPESPTDTGIQDFLTTYCLDCHNEDKQKGKFRLDNLSSDFTDPEAARKWSEVAFRIKSAEMPPPEEIQPTAGEIGHIVETLTLRIREGAASRMARRGPVEYYRLSRQEYAHTVYDLLGVVYDVEAPGTFSEDPRWHGFDRIGAMLSLAPSHMERYLDAADDVISQAFPSGHSQMTAPVKRIPAGENKRRLLQLGEGWNFRIEKPGHYRLRIQASGLPAFTGRVPKLSLWHTYHKRSWDGIELSTAEVNPEIIEFEGLYPSGTYEIRNHALTRKHANGGLSLFRNELVDASQSITDLTGGHRSPWTKVVDEDGRPVMPLILVDWVEIEGPLVSEKIQSDRLKYGPGYEDDSSHWADRLSTFARQAWRRPLTGTEIQPYVNFIRSELEAGENFESAWKSALSAILVSRSFFHLVEGSVENHRTHLNDFELASRLSYFLWSSMPDEDLFAAAEAGHLSNPDELGRQFDRMSQDPKFERFLDSFPKQWLQLHRVGMFQPDPKLYPEYGPWLEESMIEETTRYFSEMFRQDLPLREAIDSDWTMVDARLALHYGLPQPSDKGFTRTELEPSKGRGGILTQASILSLTSDGTRHRPVHRGAWVSETILAYTPPPPPPNVDPLEPVTGNQPRTTIRARLESHAKDPNCVSCHSKIDPLGLAFENFDAIGRWRETEHVSGGVGENPRVNASGTWPDGRAFSGPKEFKSQLASQGKRLSRAFLEHLATYALRRVMTVDDLEHIDSVIRSAQLATPGSDPGLRSLIRLFIVSEFFRTR